MEQKGKGIIINKKNSSNDLRRNDNLLIIIAEIQLGLKLIN